MASIEQRLRHISEHAFDESTWCGVSFQTRRMHDGHAVPVQDETEDAAAEQGTSPANKKRRLDALARLAARFSGPAQPARPSVVDAHPRREHVLHPALANCTKQIAPLHICSEGTKPGVFLSLYGGVGRVAREEARCGRDAVIVDLEDDPKNDLGTVQAKEDVCAMVSARDSKGERIVTWVGIELECRSWSMARGGPGGPPAIRSKLHVMGLPGVRPHDQVKLDSGNAHYESMMDWVDACTVEGTPGYVENGVHSWLWSTARVKTAVANLSVWFADGDMCQYGTPYKKPFRIMFFGIPQGSISFKKCRRTYAGP
jgi:hypothetical protein